MNSRGNKHSRNHISLNPDKDSAFWEFTYYEMAIYDLPAVIDYIKLKTGKQKITYFGHSQGTMQVFVGMSVLPEYFNNSLNGVIALGPVTYLTNIGSSFLSLVARTRLDYMLYYMGFREFLPSIKAVNELSVILCDKLHIICSGILELIADSNPGDVDQEKFGVFLGHFPSGTSLKDLSHFAQAVRDKTFARYDYGPSKNRELYGQDTPPSYNLTKIQNKVCLFVGKDDKLATVADNRGLKGTLEQIGNLVWYQEIDKMGHLTFFVPTDFSYNENVMKCLEEFEK